MRNQITKKTIRHSNTSTHQVRRNRQAQFDKNQYSCTLKIEVVRAR